jgi:hypothetical protein
VPGAYHFGTHGNVSGQVDAFLATAKGVNLLALDLETNGADTMTHDEAALFLRLVHAKGHKIGLYHSLSGYPHLGQDWNWVARWGTAPPPSPWAFWQYAGSPLDRDRFNGSLAQLRVLAGLPVLPKYAVAIRPIPGTRGYPDHRYFNVFTVSGSVVTAVSVARTGGFSATCSPPRTFVWPTHPSQSLVQLTSGSRAGQWVRAAWATNRPYEDDMTDDIEDVPGEPEADDADSQPVALPADANDGPVPLQAGEEA